MAIKALPPPPTPLNGLANSGGTFLRLPLQGKIPYPPTLPLHCSSTGLVRSKRVFPNSTALKKIKTIYAQVYEVY